MLLLVLLFVPFPTSSKVCEINTPIGIWLQNSNPSFLSCKVVKGHFILDSSANSYAAEIYNNFNTLKKIEGCIYVKNYTGSRNLSFFSQLENVICDEGVAETAGLFNVIHVDEPYLYQLGFNSLRNVSGPGEIFISLEEDQVTETATAEFDSLQFHRSIEFFPRNNAKPTEGQKCFSKKEMVFFARHPQFKEKMYRACETDDPCFRPDLFKEDYAFTDIPEHCTTFVGAICIYGPFDEEHEVFKKFENMALLIGWIEIFGTVFSSLEVFKNLEVIYPFNLDQPVHDCSISIWYRWLVRPFNSQVFYVGYNRFLKNFALPSLQPIRPLVVAQPYGHLAITFSSNPYLYGVDTIPNPCDNFLQFGKECQRGVYGLEIDGGAKRPYRREAQVWADVMVTIGVLIALRSLTILVCIRRVNFPAQLPTIAIMLIMIFSSLESVIINQTVYDTSRTTSRERYAFSVFSSRFLLHNIVQIATKYLAACRQVSLLIIICCCPDIILTYRWTAWRSKYFSWYSVFASVFLTSAFIYFYTNLVTEVRGLFPLYDDSEATFMTFVMNIEGQELFNHWTPRNSVIPVLLGVIEFIQYGDRPEYTVFNFPGPIEMRLENAGATFPQISFWCDVVFAAWVVLTASLQMIDGVQSRYTLKIMILLYIQMSMNRIRSFIQYDIMSQEMMIDEFSSGIFQDFIFAGENLFSVKREHEPMMWTVIRATEKLPQFSFMVISILCWKYIDYNRYLDAALLHREAEEKKNITAILEKSDSSHSFLK